MSNEIQIAPPSGMALLAELSRKITDPQAAVEIARQIVELQTRDETLRQSRERFDWEKLDREAKVAFASAFKRFKDSVPKIIKTKHVSYPSKNGGPDTNYWHVELDKACELLIPALLKVGITHQWKSQDLPDGRTRVTCFLRHELGHEEEGSSLAGPSDNSGGKNPIQGVGSSTSYLERYTFLATCGIVAAGKDNDGALSEQDQALVDAVETAETTEAVNAAYLASQASALNGKNMTLVGLLTVAAQERRKAIREAANAS
jgi:hypothetical protein